MLIIINFAPSFSAALLWEADLIRMLIIKIRQSLCGLDTVPCPANMPSGKIISRRAARFNLLSFQPFARIGCFFAFFKGLFALIFFPKYTAVRISANTSASAPRSISSR